MVEKRFEKLGMPDIERFENYLPTAFNSELTLLQKVNKIIQDLNRCFDLTNEVVDYLNRFIETFDDKLYKTVEDVLSVWLDDGRLADVVRVAINDEVIVARDGFSSLNGRLNDLKEKINGNNITINNLNKLVGVNVHDFGAKGDGVTDDTQAIQQAIDYASLEGGVVLFKSKTYVVDSVTIKTHNISLKGVKSNNHGTGTILIASKISNSGALINVIGENAMRIGGSISDIAIMANNNRQNYATIVEKIGLFIKKRAELNINNVFISGFRNGGLVARDWWDSVINSLEIRSCGERTKSSLYLGSDSDSSNSLHFFGLHIEETPFHLHIDNICSNIQFVASKFEEGVGVGWQNITSSEHFIFIYEGVYAVSFEGCFFSMNYDSVWCDVRNNLTSFNGCQFAYGRGVLISNNSTNASYGKSVIINSCQFERFGAYGLAIILNKEGVLSNNNFQMLNLVSTPFSIGSQNIVANNNFTLNVESDVALFDLKLNSNIINSNQYSPKIKKLYVGNIDNEISNHKRYFKVFANINVDFSVPTTTDILYTGGDLTLTKDNFLNPNAYSRITIMSNGATITFSGDLVTNSKQITGGQSINMMYNRPLNKYTLI